MKKKPTQCSTDDKATNCQPCVMVRYFWVILLAYALITWGLPQLGWSQSYAGKPLQGGVGVTTRMTDHGIVGVDLAIRPGNYPMVRGVFPLSPAAKAGLRVGDVVISINGGSTLNQPRPTVDAAISDIPGDNIQFLIDRPGEQPRVVMVTVMSLLDAPASLKQLYGQP